MIQHSLLKAVEPTVMRKAFDGGYAFAVCAEGRVDTAIHRIAIHNDRARAAFADAAAFLCAGQSQRVAQNVQKPRVVGCFDFHCLAVENEL